jgi:hypothetical protein
MRKRKISVSTGFVRNTHKGGILIPKVVEVSPTEVEKSGKGLITSTATLQEVNNGHSRTRRGILIPKARKLQPNINQTACTGLNTPSFL